MFPIIWTIQVFSKMHGHYDYNKPVLGNVKETFD